MKYKNLSIVIPVYNEEKYIAETIKQVVAADSCGLKKEIIVVDDGSTDKTRQEIHKVLKFIKFIKSGKLKTDASIIFIEKKINEGKGAALQTGFLSTKGDIVIVQDADLEYNPQDYILLIEPFIKNDADVVYGSRFISNRPHRVLYFWHSIINLYLTMFSNMLTNLNLTDMETGYKAFKGDLIRHLATMIKTKSFGFEPEITARISKVPNIKIYEVGISYAGRTYAEGKKIGLKDGILAIWEVIRFNLFSR